MKNMIKENSFNFKGGFRCTAFGRNSMLYIGVQTF